jgi:tRNA dimethylallyltransferase
MSPPPADVPILTLTGPTAVGKTALSLDVAERLDAEIVSADSRQVYRELTIGTAKPTPAEQARVPHHFVGERSLGEPLTAGAFAREARARIRSIRARGRRALVVGGSTLYLHALQEGLDDIPEVDASVRDALMDRLAAEGAGALYDELRRVDPTHAATLDATKTQRLMRALEVYHGTGRPLSAYHGDGDAAAPFRFVTVVLHRARQALYARINARVDAMLAAGLVAEVRGLLDAGVDTDAPPLRTIGYREPIARLHGAIDRAEMVRLVKRNSRRYAKRQLTWFRRYPHYLWWSAETTRADDLLRLVSREA